MLKQYADDRVTVGEAAEMVGCTRVDFLNLLAASGVGFRVDLDQQDFERLRRVREAAESRKR